MQEAPSTLGGTIKEMQTKLNKIIPDKVHEAVTEAIKQTTKTVLTGASITNPTTESNLPLIKKEQKVKERIKFYASTAAAEGAATGYGGFLLGLADLPLWLSLKMKMLFEIASLYDIDVDDPKERVFILSIFQITFSSQKHRNVVYKQIEEWDSHKQSIPEDVNQIDWRTYWEQYRDQIDLAKLLQLIPGFGALVGTVVNFQLTNKLGKYAMNAYRMRLGIGSK